MGLVRLPIPMEAFLEDADSDWAALDQVVSRLSRRFRLEKTDPTAARSTVKKPIIFYVDRATYQVVRTAVIDVLITDKFTAARLLGINDDIPAEG